jgi:hypothetical protein
MKRRIILCGLLAAAVLAVLLSVVPVRAHILPQLQVVRSEKILPPQDLSSLLNYPANVHIQDLAGPDRENVLTTLLERAEAIQLINAMAQKGFIPDLTDAQAMWVTAQAADGTDTHIDAAVVPMVPRRVFLPLVLKNYHGSSTRLTSVEGNGEAEPLPSAEGSSAIQTLPPRGELSAYLVAMVADDGTSFFQAHHTNVDPKLAEVPDPPIAVNGMPYFYITTLQVINGQIVYWHYWWYDSNNHPNWYFACYQHYWDYYYGYGYVWPWWHYWAYGWTYWRFWYYWSTWFPWLASP